MSSVGSRQKIRVFLEGREVPVQFVVLTSKVGAPTSATISLVPLKEIRFIKARTQVHIFLQDTKHFPDNNFYLAFEGEVLGRSMSKKHDSRSFSVVAIDYSSYWDLAKVYTMNPNYTVGKIADVVSLKDATIEERVKSMAGSIMRTSSTSNVRLIEIMLANGNKDLALGVVRAIRSMTSVNQFYKTAFERLRITDRLLLFSGNRLQQFLGALRVQEWLVSFTGQFGGISNVRDLLYSLMAIIFHDFVSVPFPGWVQDPVYGLVDDKIKTIGNFLFVPDGYSLPAPMCNIIFPNYQQGYSFEEDFREVPTRYAFRASMVLMGKEGADFPQHPTQFFPTSFSDYMFGRRTVKEPELSSSLGPSNLLTDPQNGNSYRDVFYGNPKTRAVGTSFGNVLRDSDFLTNEETIKGIHLEMDTFMPGYTALSKSATGQAKTDFIQAVGTYLFWKKRFAARQVRAELIFHPFLVPGFNAVFLDDSESGQSFIAKLQTVSHTLSHEGCATNVELAYGRDFDEIDELTGGIGEPPTPPWFDSSIFGEKNDELFKKETEYLSKLGAITQEEKDARANIKNATVYPNLGIFYLNLLGVKSMTDYTEVRIKPGEIASRPQLVTVRGAVSYLLHQYRQVASDPAARDAKVLEFIRRPLVPIMDAFRFVGAEPVGYTRDGKFRLPEEYAVFKGAEDHAVGKTKLPKRFDGIGYPDEKAVAYRRKILDKYIYALKSGVGFRG